MCEIVGLAPSSTEGTNYPGARDALIPRSVLEPHMTIGSRDRRAVGRPLGARDLASPRRGTPRDFAAWVDPREPRILERALALGCAVLAVFEVERLVGWRLIRMPLA